MPDHYPRSSGILLHPTSLPGPFGIGDIGPVAHAWIDTLADARQTWWQILPVGPTGYGDSPYQSFSTFAGNLNLISPTLLADAGLVPKAEIDQISLPTERVHFDLVEPLKLGLVRRAWSNYSAGKTPYLGEAFDRFRVDCRNWLENYALFMALKDAHGGAPWFEWPNEYRIRESKVLKHVQNELANEIAVHEFGQFLFFSQWRELRDHARKRGVRLIGDVPIFVVPDSADVWANPHLYLLDRSLQPQVVAGVPPDYFSKTGQLWGNPHYDWPAMQRTGYSWWVDRMAQLSNWLTWSGWITSAASVPRGKCLSEKRRPKRGSGRPAPARTCSSTCAPSWADCRSLPKISARLHRMYSPCVTISDFPG